MVVQLLLETPAGWQIAFVAVCIDVGLTFLAVFLWGALWGRVRNNVEPLSSSDRFVELVLVVGYATVAFAATSAVLIHHKWLLTATGVRRHDAGLAYDVGETYLWNLVNSIPVLNLPAAFNWKQHLTLSNEAGRLFILAYQLALIAPLFQLLGIQYFYAPRSRNYPPQVAGNESTGTPDASGQEESQTDHHADVPRLTRVTGSAIGLVIAAVVAWDAAVCRYNNRRRDGSRT